MRWKALRPKTTRTIPSVKRKAKKRKAPKTRIGE
jgi:hypothetical protein